MPVLIACIVGARPNFMKIAPILEALRAVERFAPRLIHTGQHYSPEMSDSFFADLGIGRPDVHLGVGAGSANQQTAEILIRLEAEFLSNRPDLVLVVGDVNSTVAAALAAVKLHIPVAHVEAGLRSFDRSMPEEINRVATDCISDYLFASEPSGIDNLRAEGVPEDKLFLTGNVMIDTLMRFRDRARESTILSHLGLEAGRYALTTLHRPANVDDIAQLRALLSMLDRLAGELPVVFPVHPRTRQRIESNAIPTGRLILTGPQGYLDFLHLTASARLVLTDSGGVQEETTILSVPCLTLRPNTERPATITHGTNRLAGTDPEAVYRIAIETLGAPPAPARTPELWDGQASRRIAAILDERLV